MSVKILTFKIETLTSKKGMDVKEWLRELNGWVDGIAVLHGESVKILEWVSSYDQEEVTYVTLPYVRFVRGMF